MRRGPKINAQATTAKRERPLKEEVREALLAVLRDGGAPAAARVAAARELKSYVEEGDLGAKPIELMAIEDIDAELAGSGPGSTPGGAG
jgi:hypothetical protein